MPYAQPTRELVAIAGGSDETVEQALNAASYDIDSAFRAAGYGTPLDPALIGPALAAKLAEVELALAGRSLSSAHRGKRGTPDKMKSDADRADAWLKRVRNGLEQFSFTAAPEDAAGVKVIGSAQATDFDSLFKVACSNLE